MPSQAHSEYHYLLLYAEKLVAINQVSGKVAAEVNWGPGSHAPGIIGTRVDGCSLLVVVVVVAVKVDLA
jgi:hypothetical protein